MSIMHDVYSGKHDVVYVLDQRIRRDHSLKTCPICRRTYQVINNQVEYQWFNGFGVLDVDKVNCPDLPGRICK